jgi:glycosyltransferase involved in cell wall biosynthesis
MKISGFSFVRNGIKLYYPVVESVKSMLPIVDEFIIVIGQGDDDDTTREAIAAIGDPKIKIIDTVWEEKYFQKGVINAIQTNIAKQACSGDWLFYLQADEVVHEKFLPEIQTRCEELLSSYKVEGLIFRYKHFWGDYDHYHAGHGWYSDEIRIIRNRPDIFSWQSAQSFRRFDYYDNPRQPGGHHKLKVARVAAEIYHYGWVRPPHLMQNKSRALNTLHWGIKRAEDHYEKAPKEFDYGPLNLLASFKGMHPKVMEQKIKKMDWKDKLQYQGKSNPSREPHKHERLKYRLLSLIEKYLNGGEQIGGFRNYILLKNV